MTLRLFYAEESNIAYLRTPKCAGMTMEKTFLNLYKYENVHAFPANKVKFIKGAKTFIVVRNPWDRAVSQFEYCRKMGTHYSTFEEFMLTDNFLMPRLSKSYLDDASFYLKFEDLENEVNKKLSPENKINLSHFNSSPRQFDNYRNYYTSESLIDMVHTLNRQLIEKIGYKF